MCLIKALLHALLVRFKVVLQIAPATAPDEDGTVFDRLVVPVPVSEALARSRLSRSGAFLRFVLWLVHYSILGRFQVGRDGRCLRKEQTQALGDADDGNDGFVDDGPGMVMVHYLPR